MLETTLILTGAAIMWGWLWCSPSAHLLDPITDRLHPWVDERWQNAPIPSVRDEFWGWLMHRLDCPICMGFDMTVAAAFMLGWQGWDSVAVIAAANGIHIAWMSWLNQGDT